VLLGELAWYLLGCIYQSQQCATDLKVLKHKDARLTVLTQLWCAVLGCLREFECCAAWFLCSSNAGRGACREGVSWSGDCACSTSTSATTVACGCVLDTAAASAAAGCLGST
jgi:hypothetical protein